MTFTVLVQNVERGNEELVRVLLFVASEVPCVRPDEMKQPVWSVRHACSRVELDTKHRQHRAIT